MTMMIIIIRAFLNMGICLFHYYCGYIIHVNKTSSYIFVFESTEDTSMLICWTCFIFCLKRAWHDNHVKIVWNSGFSSKHQAWWLQEHFSIFNRKIFEITMMTMVQLCHSKQPQGDRLVLIFWWWSCSNMFSKPRSHDVFPFFVLSHVNDTCNFPSK